MSEPTLASVAARIYAQLRIYTPDDEANGWWYAHYLQGLTMFLQPFDEALRDRPDGSSGVARMLDPEETPSWMLDYLQMFDGVVYPKNISDDAKRQMLLQTPAQERGGEAAIRGRARRSLTDPVNSHVFIQAPAEGEGPLSIAITTLSRETPDPARTQRDLEQGDIIAAGIKVLYSATEEQTIAEWDAEDEAQTIAAWVAANPTQTIEAFDHEGV